MEPITSPEGYRAWWLLWSAGALIAGAIVLYVTVTRPIVTELRAVRALLEAKR